MTNGESDRSNSISPSCPQGVAASEPELRPWDSGEAVETLQTLLNAHGFVLRVDGEFNSRTEAAVRAYQAQQELKSNGIVNAVTWAKLQQTIQPGTRLLRKGAIGADVYELQGLLNVNGYSVCRNSVFNAETRTCVIAFQQTHKLRANGVVGAITWRLLRGRPLPSPPPKQQNWW